MKSKSLSDRTFGILLNPRDGGLFYAVRSYRGTEVVIFDMDQVRPVVGENNNRSAAGRGHFHAAYRVQPNHPEREPNFAEVASGYPRVHSPSGVARKGEGLGTVLYSALCFASDLNHRKQVAFWIDPSHSKPGISSMAEDRSKDADVWWKSAVSKYGLASENTFCRLIRERFNTNSIDKEKRARLLAEIQSVIARSSAGNSVRNFKIIGGLELDAEFKRCAPIDVMEFSSIKKNHIPIAWLSDEYDPLVIAPYRTEAASWRGAGGARRADIAPLVNADYGRFDETNPKHQQIFLWVATLARLAGATKRQLEGMRLRFAEGADIEFEPKPYVIEQALELGLWAPSGGIMNTGRRSTIEHATAPRWRPRLRRASAAISTPLQDELQRLSEARKALGWASFAMSE